jgi:hypothetical protein
MLVNPQIRRVVAPLTQFLWTYPLRTVNRVFALILGIVNL